MAKAKGVVHIERKRVKRPGVHAKSKTSKLKTSKNYQKKYRGQGKQTSMYRLVYRVVYIDTSISIDQYVVQ